MRKGNLSLFTAVFIPRALSHILHVLKKVFVCVGKKRKKEKKKKKKEGEKKESFISQFHR